MSDTLGDLVTIEIALYWGLNGKTRVGAPRGDHIYHVPMGAVNLFIDYTFPVDPNNQRCPMGIRKGLVEDTSTEFVKMYKQFT
jgi:hypothetical protein